MSPSPVPIVDPQQEATALAQTADSSAGVRAKGIVLTPYALAIRLAEATLPLHSNRILNIIDPTCGSGRLLAAAAEVAHNRGLAVKLHGIELEEPLARVAADSLPHADIQTGNALQLLNDAHAYDIVLLNPPYRGRLRRADSHAAQRADALKARFGDLLGPYADPSTGFLLLAQSLLCPSGRLGAIVPVSIASARDAHAARCHLATHCDTLDCWSEPAPFAAQVHTASIILERRATPRPGAINDWATRLARAAGVPNVELPATKTIGDVATVTADFRDEFYALQDHVVECDETPNAIPVVTCGLVDPGVLLHGSKSARLHGSRWTRPGVVSHRDLEPLLNARLVPKVLVATQTRVIEAAPDPDGTYMPCTPLVRIVPSDPINVWRITASLCAPQTTAIAIHRHFGAGRAPNTLRLRATDIAALPLLPDTDATSQAMDAARSLHHGSGTLESLLQLACAAFGHAPQGLLEWWWSKAPQHLARH